MKIEILVKSSSSENYYTINISSKNNLLFAKCDCNAGQNFMLCKHLANFINGVDKDNTEQFAKFIKTPEYEKLKNYILNYNESSKELSKQIEILKKEETKIKKMFMRKLYEDGI